MTFEELSAKRKILQNFCRRHYSSLMSLKQEQGKGFRHTDEQGSDTKLHLTTTATCIESLLKCQCDGQAAKDRYDIAINFAKEAMELDTNKWVSDGSASVYCRCRALPLIVRTLEKYDDQIEGHLKHILSQLDKDPNRFAIGEASPDPEGNENRSKWYPANAFHTYWTLELLDSISERHKDKYEQLCKKLNLTQKRSGMLLWTRKTFGYQLSLHFSGSPVLDTDQLCWSLATLLKFDERHFHADLGEQNLLHAAVERIFSTQLKNGTWRHYRSLFHYKAAGNAYCYVYETFAVLLEIALSHKLFQDALSEYASQLIDLFQYAETTSMQIDGARHPNVTGWCSGHRTNQLRPESWATASVYSFAQALRRLYGIWTSEAALSALNRVDVEPRENAEKTLSMRSSVWTVDDDPNVEELLFSMFINPVRRAADESHFEPDYRPICDRQARSAILFGPPGTSKTTLCRALAGAIEWKYVELHASHFVADGLGNVQKTADDIFRKLMEIDHAVVLFDEIDELVREREKEHDAFGRFLTTSMLPKLAELWNQKKIIYFVATNHIEYFDLAITRSHRFDALIYVAPPSYDAKIRRLGELLKTGGKEIIFGGLKEDMWTAAELIAQVDNVAGKKKAGAARTEEDNGAVEEEDNGTVRQHVLGKFVLLRWDQLDELAYFLRSAGDGAIGMTEMKNALLRLRDRNLDQASSYGSLMRDRLSGRRDYDKDMVWKVEGLTVGEEIEGCNLRWCNGDCWLTVQGDGGPPPRLGPYELEVGARNRGIAKYAKRANGRTHRRRTSDSENGKRSGKRASSSAPKPSPKTRV